MKVVFLTVFLGLIAGQQPVEVMVTGEATRVEFVLDHEVVAVANAAPWRAVVDFGASPLPHRLEARVFGKGAEAEAIVTQKVNASAPARHLEVVVDRTSEERAARVLWSSVDRAKPDKVEARFDGAPIGVSRELTIALPRYDDGRAHLLEVSARAGAEETEAQVVLGAVFESDVATEVTAVPVRIKGAAPAAKNIACSTGATSVETVAIDDLPGEVIIVRARSASEAATVLESGTGARRATVDATARLDVRPMTAANTSPSLTRGDRVRFLWATPRIGKGSVAAVLFDSSRSYSTTEDTPVPLLLTRLSAAEGGAAMPRYADAVGVAGLQASQSQRPRAVVLILGAKDADGSQMRPAGAVAYLHSLGVPLHVWSLADPARLPGALRAWGEITSIASRSQLDSAIAALRRDLDAQRIVWVSGDYLVPEVTVKSDAVEALALTHPDR